MTDAAGTLAHDCRAVEPVSIRAGLGRPPRDGQHVGQGSRRRYGSYRHRVASQQVSCNADKEFSDEPDSMGNGVTGQPAGPHCKKGPPEGLPPTPGPGPSPARRMGQQAAARLGGVPETKAPP